MTDIPFAATTPVSVSRVGLRARDADTLADYYKNILGLREFRRGGNHISLGAGDRELLEIEGSPALKPDDPRSAGLFHTAFLLPTRPDLARWVRHAMDRRLRIDGASDHKVSEAFYLTDPEGNGIEIYADRPRESWSWEGSTVKMSTDPLDTQNLLGEIGEGDQGWAGAPDGSVVGHVHLRVGNVKAAEKWWNEAQNFATMVHYGEDAVFLSTGGYHHHIGANSWRSRGAGPRDADRTGLAFVEMVSREADRESVSVDPWRNEIRVIPVKN